MLSEYLRKRKNLVGTKIVCAEGDCGSCTLLRLFPLQAGKQKNIFLPINSCITTLAQMDGSSLVTVEALATAKTISANTNKFLDSAKNSELTSVQKAMMNCHGSQCGFCTPGFVMALTGLVEKKLCSTKSKIITDQEAKNALTGNLCRCTGYQPIIDAAKSIDFTDSKTIKNRFYSAKIKNELLKILKIELKIEVPDFSFTAPVSIKKAVVNLNKNTRLVAAATDLGVVHNKRKIQLNKLLSLHLIPHLYKIKKISKNRLYVGARVTLSDLREQTKTSIPEFATFLDLFASPQIKNVATLVGNIATASPIADTPPFLLLMNTNVEITGPKGKRSVPLEDFFIAYRKINLKEHEIITALIFDIPKKSEVIALYKVSQRKDMDISAVNFAARLTWSDSNKNKIKQIKFAVGGVAATTLRLHKTEKVLLAAKPTAEKLAEAVLNLHSEISPLSDLRGSDAFRHVIAENLFHKFFREKVL